MEYLFVHGWGFSSRVWGDVGYDRGYFGGQIDPVGPFDTVVVHSMGLHFLNTEHLVGVKKLVILSGFVRIAWEGRSLERMIKNITKDPIGVLHDFYQLCGYNGEATWLEGDLNTELLKSDLILLQRNSLDLQLFKGLDVEIFYGIDDQVVPLKCFEELHDALPNSRLNKIAGGHFATVDYCRQLLKSGRHL